MNCSSVRRKSSLAPPAGGKRAEVLSRSRGAPSNTRRPGLRRWWRQALGCFPLVECLATYEQPARDFERADLADDAARSAWVAQAVASLHVLDGEKVTHNVRSIYVSRVGIKRVSLHSGW